MDVEKMKETAIIALRRIEDEARILLERCAKARSDLLFVQTDVDWFEYEDKHDLGEGFNYIRLF